MAIVGAFILPHGAMILDPEKDGIPKQAIKLHKEMKNVAKIIEKLKPDLIFLTSPHSISLSNDFGIYLNESGSGSAEWNDDYKNYKVKVEIDQEIANELLDYLSEKETAINGIASFTPSVDAPFRWGEAVPLWFLRNLSTKPKYVILSQPLRRHDQAKDMIPETITLGNDLRLYFESIEKRIVILVSADLGHTHKEDGPYGFNEAAESFDELIEQWASTLDEKILTKKVLSKIDQALCCGYIGFVLLQGMIQNKGFTPNVLIRETPSYYGMMIATYLKE